MVVAETMSSAAPFSFQEMEFNIRKKFAQTHSPESVTDNGKFLRDVTSYRSEIYRVRTISTIGEDVVDIITDKPRNSVEKDVNAAPVQHLRKKALQKFLESNPVQTLKRAFSPVPGEPRPLSVPTVRTTTNRPTSWDCMSSLVSNRQLDKYNDFLRRYAIPDVQFSATQKSNMIMLCVSAALLVHINNPSDSPPRRVNDSFCVDVFRDSAKHVSVPSPRLDDLITYLGRIFLRSQMEYECLVAMLIYIERLPQATDGRLRINKDNWKSVCLACCVLANKMWDDFSMWNEDMSRIDPNFPLARINDIEIEMLKCLQFDLRVSHVLFSKYLNHIVNMIAVSAGCYKGTVNREMQAAADIVSSKHIAGKDARIGELMGKFKMAMGNIFGPQAGKLRPLSR